MLLTNLRRRERTQRELDAVLVIVTYDQNGQTLCISTYTALVFAPNGVMTGAPVRNTPFDGVRSF